MTVDTRASRPDGPLKELPAEIGFAVAGSVAVICAVLSVATIHLMLSQPTAITGALVEPGIKQVAWALASLLVAAIRDLVGFL